MIGRIFLGKIWHWAALASAAALLWYAGGKRWHVIEFNWFILAMLAGTAVVLLAIIRLHRDGEQVTRDQLVAQAFDPDDDAPVDRE